VKSGRFVTSGLIIAAIARARGASVVTRDTGGFEGCGLTLIDPWSAA
jgi:predicted nucleic acid-binding protein